MAEDNTTEYENSGQNFEHYSQTENNTYRQYEMASDIQLTNRLDELVEEANRQRTYACGLNAIEDRKYTTRKLGNNPSKVPGSTVTQDDIDEQRR